MTKILPQAGYLALPLVFRDGALGTTTLAGSIEGFLRLNLNVPLQKQERPAWLPADGEIGCRVPHYDFQTVANALHSDVGDLVSAIRATIPASDPRVAEVSVEIDRLDGRDVTPEGRDGTPSRGSATAVTIHCKRVDGETQFSRYVIAFGGTGPVFGDD